MKNTFKKVVWCRKMDTQKVKGDKPDSKGSLDVAAWFNTDSDGEIYLSVVIGNRARLVPNADKTQDQ